MAITLVTSVTANPGIHGGTSSAIDTTGATLLVLSVAHFGSVTISDSKGNTWVPLTQRTGASSIHQQCFYVATPTVGTGHTFTVSGFSIYTAFVVQAYTDTAGAPIFDGENGSTSFSTGTSVSTGSVTPTVAGSLIVSGLAIGGFPQSPTVDSGLTATVAPGVSGSALYATLAYLVQATPAALNPTWSWASSAEYAASVAVFRPAAAAAPVTRLTQLPAEVAASSARSTRVSQAPVEVLDNHPAGLRMTQAIVEILLPSGPLPEPMPLGTPGLAWIEWRGRVPEPEALTATPRADILETVAYSDWDMQCPPDYYHGFKAARVESFGTATRTLSDARTGDWQGSACEIRLHDPDRALRTALATTPGRFGQDALVTVRMVSRPVRAELGEPLIVFSGPIRRAEPSPQLSFTLLLEDAVGHGMLTDDLLIPQRVVDASYLPEDLVLDARAIGHPVPIIYGTHARPLGAYAPVYLGIEGTTQHVWLVAGHYAAVTDVLLEGVSVLGGDPADWTLPGRSGPLTEDYGGRRYTLLRGRVGTPPTPSDPVLYGENAGIAGSYFESWVVALVDIDADVDDPPLSTVSHWDPNDSTSPRTGSRALHGVDLREGDAAEGYFGQTVALDDPLLRGYWLQEYTSLVLYVKTETLGWVDASLRLQFTYGSPSDEHLLEAGIPVTLEGGLYDFDDFDTSGYQRIEIPVEAFEVPATAPPDGLWIVKVGDGDLSCFIDDITLEGGEGDPGEETPADRAAAGAPLTLNVTGWTTTGDDSGSVITDLYAQYQHFLITYVATPDGYLAGAPPANPTIDLYDRIVDTIDETSFSACSAQAVGRYPPVGYVGKGVLGATAGDRLSVRQWIARWNLSADCRLGISRYGEVFIVLAAPTIADRDGATLIDEVNDILEGTFSLAVGWEQQATRVPYRADYDWATGQWLAVGRDAEAGALHDVYGRPEGIVAPVKDYWFVPTSDQGKNVAEHEVERIGHPPRVLEFETNLDLATAGLGGYLRVRHFAGVGPSETRLVQIEELTVAPGRRRVRIRAVDVTALVVTEEELASRVARVGFARVGLARLGYAG